MIIPSPSTSGSSCKRPATTKQEAVASSPKNSFGGFRDGSMVRRPRKTPAERAFLASLRNTGEAGETACLVYADWLDDQGRAQEASYQRRRGWLRRNSRLIEEARRSLIASYSVLWRSLRLATADIREACAPALAQIEEQYQCLLKAMDDVDCSAPPGRSTVPPDAVVPANVVMQFVEMVRVMNGHMRAVSGVCA